MVTRRRLLATAVSASWMWPDRSQAAGAGTRMGGAPTAFANRARLARQRNEPFDLLEHCHRLGLGGIETGRPPADPGEAAAFRRRLETYQMRVVFNIPLPRAKEDLDAFEAGVKAAKDCGAIALHAAMTQRRYEQFDALEPFRTSFEQNQHAVSLAEPLLRKHRLRLAIENHKGWRAAEQSAWLNRLGSEYVGVAFDFGNNLALCETPAQTLRILAPLAIFCHIKDMAMERYRDGFLLSEVPFGEGFLDLKEMVRTLRDHDPDMLFCLEMITRDPLKVPVLTKRYWATFDDSYSPLPGRDLAAVLELARDHPPATPLPRISHLSPEEQVKAEDEYNRQCIAYARKNMDL